MKRMPRASKWNKQVTRLTGEGRMLGYTWHTERLFKEMAPYADFDNPVDGVLKGGAAVVHVITGIGDSVINDLARLVQGKESRVPLEAYGDGFAPKTGADVTEGIGSIKNTAKGKITSIITLPLAIVKLPGDVISDGADRIAGVERNGSLSLAA